MSEPTLEELKAMVDKLEAEAATAAPPEPPAEKPVRQRKAATEAPADTSASVEAPAPVTAISHTAADTTLTASIDDGGGVAVQIERAGHVVHKFELEAEKVLRQVV